MYYMYVCIQIFLSAIELHTAALDDVFLRPKGNGYRGFKDLAQ